MVIESLVSFIQKFSMDNKVAKKSYPYNNVLSKNIDKVDIVRINRLHKGTKDKLFFTLPR